MNASDTAARTSSDEEEDTKVQRIKRLIQQGNYESPEKLDVALERLLDDLARGEDPAWLKREDESGDEPL